MIETALITGASSGIGEALARLIAGGGRHVVLLARSGDRLAALARELSGGGVQASVLVEDLADPEAPGRIARELDSRGVVIDILVNNAGFGVYGPFAETPEGPESQLLQVNVVALTMLAKTFLPGMVSRRRGRVLNVGSTAAFQPGPLMAVYYASKAYVLSFSEALSNETEGTGVTVTCLCPGPTSTGFEERAGLAKSKLFSRLGVMSVADVARAGYDAMMAGDAIAIPGFANKVGVQMLRATPRAMVRRIVRNLQERR